MAIPTPLLQTDALRAELWRARERVQGGQLVPMEPVSAIHRKYSPNPHKFYVFYTSGTERMNLSSSLPYCAVRRLTNTFRKPNTSLRTARNLPQSQDAA
ncbi:hypothetical protein B0H19DRAFT_1167099 [Mycena capillaripes]|nr:hypothetical protein B0H19DRAFT_1167099 [Mycena capillaripes]